MTVLAGPENVDRESVYVPSGIRGWGSHGQLAKPGEKHREGKPSTETRRGRPHLDVPTHDRARGGDRIGVPESGRRSRVVARHGRPVLRQFQELLRGKPPSGFRPLRRPPRLREFVCLVERTSEPRPDGDGPDRKVLGVVRGGKDTRSHDYS